VRSDVSEAIAFDGHIPDEGGASRAVVDGAAADENIVVSHLAAGRPGCAYVTEHAHKDSHAIAPRIIMNVAPSSGLASANRRCDLKT